ncbi:unnamed protein product [Oncorhynchus mykiss]|uniref:RNA-binding protein 39 n=1 Tax=Oncorhynchus mykiss TaxID=8022 RepID=A0A060YB39_ONCMY|nr:unnamed protein product [Oncorhynchus mykiss]
MADDFDIEAMLEAPYRKTCLTISHLYFHEFQCDLSKNEDGIKLFVCMLWLFHMVDLVCLCNDEGLVS